MKRPSDSIYQKDGEKPENETRIPQLEDDLFYREYRASQRKTFIVVVGFFLLIVLSFVVIMQQQQLRKRPNLSDAEPPAEPPLDYVSASGFSFNEASDNPIFAVEDLLEVEPEKIPEDKDLPFTSRWVKQAGHHLASGDRYFRDAHYEKALQHYEKAIKIYPELYDVYKHIGLIQLRKKRYDEAILAFEIASKHDPLNHGLLNNLGVAELARNNMEQAATYFERSLTLTTGYPLAHYNLASLYYRMENFEKAVQYFESYDRLDGSNMEAAQMHANALIRLERWEEATDLLQSIVHRAPDVAPVYFRLAQTLAMSGDTTAALRALDKGIKLVDARKALSWMSRNEFDILRNNPRFQQMVQNLGKTES